ncbi:MAG: RluA family pseudouridine synthase [Limosilactobacillus oris]|jgi:23S rRNA pseudouridine1911/1915/1917 synthase|uniref:RluA family pseudouridine synthase n=1 Tax=Limosilactobacillus oris TaxID=1632 RepID=UPI000789F699|nr:RluA family pseudouridine synthase [Limosilactobacillus oris]AMS07733.1 pseudouridine synthase [Limosilactobacillus oris]MCH3911601.1 RluA family pseudouridine synthase [Limosilactobacillus oris]MCH3938851.1 RluA family pseudouridine synthase [Limosilactobacillus oris]MCI1981256.1 RluA family pseudouridine synthase [Limosilactobacillus oris]MCI2043374.1 RluA family pseudouridine synthase [Limosilactobacillus oris]
MADTLKLTVDDTLTGRIDKVLAHQFNQFSRSHLQKWIEDGNVRVNGQPVKPKYKLAVGDQVVIEPEAPQKVDLTPEKIPLDIVYEDDDVIVVNKPQGMVVHPAPGHPNHTLVNALLYHSPLSTINGEFRPGIVHRIDKDTSGLLMIAKNDLAHRSLAAQLKAKTNQREYVALVHGVIKQDAGTINAPIGRSKKDRKKQAVVSDGRHAVTHFKVLHRFRHYTLVSCRLETGRTHQIRVHMKSIGHPLAGDPLYGPRKTLPGRGQYLHARLLGFKHPRTGKELVFTAPLPEYFQQMLDKLKKTDSN